MTEVAISRKCKGKQFVFGQTVSEKKKGCIMTQETESNAYIANSFQWCSTSTACWVNSKNLTNSRHYLMKTCIVINIITRSWEVCCRICIMFCLHLIALRWLGFWNTLSTSGGGVGIQAIKLPWGEGNWIPVVSGRLALMRLQLKTVLQSGG